MKTATTSFRKLSFTVIGFPSNKPTFVFIHGLGSSQNYYYSIASKLAQSYQCVLLDNFGAARSPSVTLIEAPEDVQTMALDVLEVANECSLSDKPVLLVGHSMGGLIVNYINSKLNGTKVKLWNGSFFTPQIVKSVLIGPVHPTPKISTVFRERVELLKKEGTIVSLANTIPFKATGPNCSALKQAFIRELIINQDVNGYIFNCNVIANAGANLSDELVDLYKKIKIPYLIIYGEVDQTAPWKGCVEVIANQIENSQVEMLKGVGHWHCIEDDETTLKLIENFV